jgi:hypothetical protein
MRYFLLCLTFVGIALAADRTVDVQINPNCDACGKIDTTGTYNNLVYVKLTGADDLIHILYSNIDSFTVMLFKTDLDSKLTVSADDLLSKNATRMLNSISFSKAPLESCGYSFPIIYEFNDDNGTADMNKIPDDMDHWFLHKTSDLKWNQFKMVDNSSGVFEGIEPNMNGSYKFVVKFPGKDIRDKTLPHLLLTPESSTIDFVLDSLVPRFNSTKFGIGAVFLADMSKNAVSKSSEKTLDDEYTPGTFTLWSVKAKDENSSVASYFQWKPIFYYFDPKSLENSTLTMQYELKSGQEVPLGIGAAFYQNSASLMGMNISFGLQGDQKDGYYYSQTDFSSWTFLVGLGTPPVEKMSPVVTLVIFIGFGLPALVIVLGILFMVVKKIRGNRSEFQRL